MAGKPAKIEDDEEIDIEDDDDSLLDIEIVDDVPEKDKDKKVAPLVEESTDTDDDPSEDEIKTYSDKVKSRIDKLTAKYHQERRSKEAAARQLDELARITQTQIAEGNRLKELINKGEGFWKETNKNKVESQLQVAKREYREAFDAGDVDKLSEAQEKITKLSIELDKTVSWNPEPLKPYKAPVQQRQEPVVDTKAQDWHSKNSWFGEDDRMTSFAMALHRDLVKKGIDPQTPSYYNSIDAEMRKTFPDTFKGEKSSRTSGGGTVVAGASRSSGKTSRKVVKLTATQVALAKRLGVTNEQYANEVLRLENDR